VSLLHQVEDLEDQLTVAMMHLRRKARGMPTEERGFRTAHRRLTKDVAVLFVNLEAAAEARHRPESE
jgi:hypothetical protein